MANTTEELLRPYPVVLELPVLWGDMDAFGHVNNVIYFRWFENARIAYFERAQVPATGRGVGPILASTSCRFKAPLTHPDTVYACARVSEIGEDRFTMEYAIVSEGLGRIAAKGDGIVVTYDYDAGKKTPVPESWREKILALDPHLG